jgi:hypothetical protein
MGFCFARAPDPLPVWSIFINVSDINVVEHREPGIVRTGISGNGSAIEGLLDLLKSLSSPPNTSTNLLVFIDLQSLST